MNVSSQNKASFNIILIWSCGPLVFILFAIFPICLYDGGSRSKTVRGVSSFFSQVGNLNVLLELLCLKTFLKYVSHVS